MALKIGLVAPPWLPVPPHGYGGIETAVDALARGAVAAGHDVTLFSTGDSDCPVPQAWVYERAETRRMGDVAVELTHVLAAYDALADVDVVHDHTLSGAFVAPPAPPVIVTAHGPADGILGPVYRAIGRRATLVAISHRQAEAIGAGVDAVIHHGVDLSRHPAGPGDGGYFLFLGRMAPDKGVHTAARVARLAGMPLVIAARIQGEDEEAYFEEAVRPLLGPGVEYVGEARGEHKMELLGRATALLNPIDWPEPFGLVMVEALACGTPVIVTPNGAATEIVRHGETGFVCDSDDELVAALGKVASLDRGACRDAAERDFSAERMVEHHLALYERVAEHG